MNTVLRAGGPVDLLAYIPYRLGFRPRDSVVLLGLRPPRSSIGLVMRMDLEGVADDVHGSAMLAEARRFLAEDGATDAFVALYSELPGARVGAAPPVCRAVARLRRETTWSDPPAPWVIGADGYGTWGMGQRGAPLGGSLADLEHSPMAAALVVEGLTVVPDRTNLAVPPTAEPARRRAALAGLHLGRRRRHSSGQTSPRPSTGSVGTPAATLEWRDEQRRYWEQLLGRVRRGASLPAGDLGLLVAGLEDRLVRDGLLCAVIAPLPSGLPAPQLIEDTLDAVLRPGGAAPDQHRLDPAVTVLREIAGCLSGRSRVPALGMLAWLAWWCGDSARADVLAEQCLAIDPGHRLAELVVQAVDARLPPGWVRAAEVRGGGRTRPRSIR